jgi:small subunit ribosomal protein S14
MANKSKIEGNKNKQKLVAQYAAKRMELKKAMMCKTSTVNERFKASQELAKMKRNSAVTRLRNRCGICGRPRGYFRDFGMSRIWLRTLAGQGMLPGVVKSSG